MVKRYVILFTSSFTVLTGAKRLHKRLYGSTVKELCFYGYAKMVCIPYQKEIYDFEDKRKIFRI